MWTSEPRARSTVEKPTVLICVAPAFVGYRCDGGISTARFASVSGQLWTGEGSSTRAGEMTQT